MISSGVAANSGGVRGENGGFMRRLLVLAASCALLAAGWIPAAGAASNGSRHVIAGSHPSWAVASNRSGDVDPSSDVVVRIYLRGADDAGLEAVARAVSDPHSTSYHHFLTPAAVRARYAPTAASVSAVEGWAQSSGLQVDAVPANNMYVEAFGPAGQVAAAFGVHLGNYRVHGMQLRAPDAQLTVPASIADVVSGVVGVDQSESLLQPDHIAAVPNSGQPSGFRNAPPCSAYWAEKLDTTDPAYSTDFPNPLPYALCGYTPPQMRSAYGVASSVDAGHTGASATVAIVDAFASPTIFQDASTYAVRHDPTHPLTPSQFSQAIFKPVQKLGNVKQCDAEGWYGEETLDVEAVHGMAPGAHILYVGGGDCTDVGLDVALNLVVANHLAQIVSNSYGDQGEDIPAELVQEFQRIAIQAAAEGIGVYFSSGDNGDEVSTLGHAAADFPASSPWVTAVGGTSLGIGADGSTMIQTGWETGESVLKANGTYAPAAPGSFLYGSGGGTSTLFAEPAYQTGVVPDSLPNENAAFPGRVIPDISMDGDPTTGFLVGQTQQFPGGAGVQYSEYRIGGTSLSSPLFAGLMALADETARSPHGFINPSLYSLAGTSAITDVVHANGAAVRNDYNNTVDARRGITTTVRTFDFPGLAIATADGYDNTTGLGVPNGSAFLTHI
jgi:subtilase family serine protease